MMNYDYETTVVLNCRYYIIEKVCLILLSEMFKENSLRVLVGNIYLGTSKKVKF